MHIRTESHTLPNTRTKAIWEELINILPEFTNYLNKKISDLIIRGHTDKISNLSINTHLCLFF